MLHRASVRRPREAGSGAGAPAGPSQVRSPGARTEERGYRAGPVFAGSVTGCTNRERGGDDRERV